MLPIKPAPPVTTMRRLLNHRRRRSVPRDIPLFSPKSSFRWLAEPGSSGFILSSLLKDLSKVLLGQVWWSLAFRTSCWLRRPGSLPRPSVGLSRLIQSRAAGRNSVSIRALGDAAITDQAHAGQPEPGFELGDLGPRVFGSAVSLSNASMATGTPGAEHSSP